MASVVQSVIRDTTTTTCQFQKGKQILSLRSRFEKRKGSKEIRHCHRDREQVTSVELSFHFHFHFHFHYYYYFLKAWFL